MTEAVLMFLLVLIIPVAWAWIVRGLNPKELLRYLKSQPKAFGGVKAAIAVVAIILVFGALLNGCAMKNVKTFQYVELYAGLERTDKPSPACDPGGIDDKSVSNIGINGHIFSTLDDTLTVESYIRHHSCYINNDKHAWDSKGIQSKYKIWTERIIAKIKGWF